MPQRPYEKSDTKMKIEQKLKRKMIFRIKWKVHPQRKDKRTGAIDPVPRSTWAHYLMEEETKRIRGNE